MSNEKKEFKTNAYNNIIIVINNNLIRAIK